MVIPPVAFAVPQKITGQYILFGPFTYSLCCCFVLTKYSYSKAWCGCIVAKGGVKVRATERTFRLYDRVYDAADHQRATFILAAIVQRASNRTITTICCSDGPSDEYKLIPPNRLLFASNAVPVDVHRVEEKVNTCLMNEESACMSKKGKYQQPSSKKKTKKKKQTNRRETMMRQSSRRNNKRTHYFEKGWL